jgi:hypothetical protein
MCSINLRLAGLVSVIRISGLSRGDRGVINKLEQMLSETGNDGNLLRVLAHGIELVGESSLELLASNVGELSLGNQGFSFGAHEFLLKNDDPRRVRLLVLQLGNLIRDLLLALDR